jgi:cobalt-precorrin 5A hydrolase/precorrin-3B C17-methyltransferase
VLARQLGRADERLATHTLATFPSEAVDMFTLVLIGNSQTREQEGLLLTPRGYPPGAESGKSG